MKRIRDHMRIAMGLRIHTRSPENYAIKYPALAKRRAAVAPPARPRDFSLVTLGTEHGSGRHVVLEELARLEHTLLVGNSGSGKTHLTKLLALQDFRRGRGGVVIDPHGSHSDSLHHELISELHRDGFFETGRAHIIDPNIRSHITPINFLARLGDTEVSVIADALLQAFERVWGDEDTLQKPTIRAVLKATFMTLCELNLPLSDARFLFDPHDTAGFRARTLTKLSNEYAREELERLHTMALDERSKRDFRATVVGPINRLAEFVSCDAIRTMVGVVDPPGKRITLDLLDGMNKGHIYLVNLSHGPAVSEADTKLLGCLLLRYLFLLGTRRTNLEPFFIYCDEAAKFLTGDIPNLLAEARKYGIALHANLQYMAQAGKPDDLMYQALETAEVQIRFRVKSLAEATRAAEQVLKFNLERPLVASIRPTVVANRRTRLASRSQATHAAESEGTSETETNGISDTESYSTGVAIGTSTSSTTAAGTFAAAGTNNGTVLSPSATLFGPNAPNASFMPYETASSEGQSASNGSSEMSATSQGTSEVHTEMRGSAQTRSRSNSSSSTRSRTRGQSHATGESEAFENVWAELPSAFHSLENEKYFAATLIRSLPTGMCFASWRGKSVCVAIPPPPKEKL